MMIGRIVSTSLLAAALALYLALRYVERQLFIRRMRMDRISVDELARMIDEGLNPVIFDVRHAEARSRARSSRSTA